MGMGWDDVLPSSQTFTFAQESASLWPRDLMRTRTHSSHLLIETRTPNPTDQWSSCEAARLFITFPTLLATHQKENQSNKIRIAMSTQFSITIPPGKLGIHLEDFRSDVSSTVVSSVNDESPLAGKVFKGDYIVCVNGVDVHKMDTASKNKSTLWYLLWMPLIAKTTFYTQTQVYLKCFNSTRKSRKWSPLLVQIYTRPKMQL